MPLTTSIERPARDEYTPFLEPYISLVTGSDALGPLAAQIDETLALLAPLTESRALHRYAPGKWSVKETAVHMGDFERVFAYRALHFARGSTDPLPSFDEVEWTPSARADARPIGEIVEELRSLRAATLALFRSFDAEALARRGIASGNPLSVRATAWSIVGHDRHHLKILRERYAIGGEGPAEHEAGALRSH